MWMHQLERQFLDGAQAPDPSFGSFELRLVPPFGRRDD